MAESSQTSPQPIAEIDHGPSKFDQFMENHQKKLIVGAILIALAVVGYVVWSGIEEGKQRAAGAALVKADEAADYNEVISKNPETHAAATAMPLLANLQWPDSQPDSISTLEDFIAKYPEHPALLTAKTSLGLRLLDQGKLNEAREALTEVADNHSDSYMAPLACIALGDISKAEGKASEAKEWYEKATGENMGNSAYQSLAQQRLAIVNAKPPVKIKPAPPAPPTPAPAPSADGAPSLPTVPGTPTAPTQDNSPSKPTEPSSEKPADSQQNGGLPAPKLTQPDTPEAPTPPAPATETPAKPENKEDTTPKPAP